MPRRATPRRSIRAAAAAAMMLPAAAAAEARAWIVDVLPDMVRVLYGTPNSDDIALSFDCAVATRTLTIGVLGTLGRESDGLRAELVLASAGGQVAVAAHGSYSEMDDAVLFSAATRFDARLRAVLAAAGVLRLTVAADTVEVPLAGSSEAVAALAAGCGAS